MSIDSGVLAPPPLLRTLGAADAPFPGDLRAGTPPRVWVPLQDLPSEIWRVRGGEHVLAPVDLARTPDGHAALLPHCPHRLITLVAGRVREAGALVTAAVSVLRGAAEAERCGFTVGSWWVDADGCPLLATTGPAWRDDSVALLKELAEAAAPGLRQAVLDAAELISEGRITPGRRERAEDELFAAAEPAPLPTADANRGVAAIPAPRRAVHRGRTGDDLASDASSWVAPLVERDLAARALNVLGDVRSALRRTMSATRRHGLTAVRDRAGRRALSATTTRAHKDRAPRRRRRSPLLVAAAAAAIIIAVGLAWPVDESASSTTPAASTPSLDSGAVSTPAATLDSGASDAAAPAPSHSADEGDIARRLLADLASCAREQAADCSDILEDPSAGVPDSVVVEDAELREVTLLDEYGGVAAYRVSGGQQPSQVLVLVQVDGKWLIRDVYDVADQP